MCYYLTVTTSEGVVKLDRLMLPIGLGVIDPTHRCEEGELNKYNQYNNRTTFT